MTTNNKNTSNAGDHLANERTFLAWVRTSISIIAFGIAILKFSVFDNYSKEIAIVLVAVGAVATFLPFFYYKRAEKQLKTGIYSSLPITVLTVLICLVWVFLTVYLFKAK